MIELYFYLLLIHKRKFLQEKLIYFIKAKEIFLKLSFKDKN